MAKRRTGKIFCRDFEKIDPFSPFPAFLLRIKLQKRERVMR
ncbi:hypothetical protein HMPREF0262_02128 [Clostridium sp. ATCC 29733]|nr:hypothetical protein HMPREF0262_02128 [Clostridium sp. ATCC 29733]